MKGMRFADPCMNKCVAEVKGTHELGRIQKGLVQLLTDSAEDAGRLTSILGCAIDVNTGLRHASGRGHLSLLRGCFRHRSITIQIQVRAPAKFTSPALTPAQLLGWEQGFPFAWASLHACMTAFSAVTFVSLPKGRNCVVEGEKRSQSVE